MIARVREAGPQDFGRAPLGAVHAENFLHFLETAWDQWVAAHGAYDALPLVWPTRSFRHIEPEAIDGKLSYFSLDAGTPITAGTWRAITASANVALTGRARAPSTSMGLPESPRSTSPRPQDWGEAAVPVAWANRRARGRARGRRASGNLDAIWDSGAPHRLRPPSCPPILARRFAPAISMGQY